MYRKEPFPIQEKPLCIINDPFYYRIRDAVPNGKGRKRTKSSIHPLAEKHRRTCRGEKLKKYTPCTFEDSSKIVEAIAEVHAELVLIHPTGSYSPISGRKRSGFQSISNIDGIAGRLAVAGFQRNERAEGKIFCGGAGGT